MSNQFTINDGVEILTVSGAYSAGVVTIEITSTAPDFRPVTVLIAVDTTPSEPFPVLF